jgi:type IV pilus assembly protein PilE
MMPASANTHRQCNYVSRGGFTFIELMITLAIAAILATVAFPTYMDHLRRTRRTEGRAALLRVLQQQEQFYTQRRTYIAFSSSSSDGDARRFIWHSGPSPKESAYELRGEACDGEEIQNCIQLSAEPGSGRVNDRFKDPACGTLTLTSSGKRGADGPDCWK